MVFVLFKLIFFLSYLSDVLFDLFIWGLLEYRFFIEAIEIHLNFVVAPFFDEWLLEPHPIIPLLKYT